MSTWWVGLPVGATPVDGLAVVALTSGELEVCAASGVPAVAFHEAMAALQGTGLPSEGLPSAGLPSAGAVRGEVEVHLPPYRSRTLVPVLSWLVTGSLAAPGARVSWLLGKQQGPDSLARLLGRLGWTLRKRKQGRLIALEGEPPPATEPPSPAGFSALVGERDLEFSADFGVFSSGGLDAGTAHLLDVALGHDPVDTLADIGVGYGPLAVGLLANGVARRAVATDVDAVALWLAARNADRHRLPVLLRCDPDPLSVELTALTVCNVPTHIDAGQTARLMAALAVRGGHGDLLVVVHASLRERYLRHLTAAGLRVRTHEGPHHAVLQTG